jgi:hypothetical protein
MTVIHHLKIRPRLAFKNVPHWGVRATENGRVYEIERLEAGNDSSRPRFRAFVRKKGGRGAPLADQPFMTRISAETWLEAHREAAS